jgi:N-succinyldiaminopimelate aminotransferase
LDFTLKLRPFFMETPLEKWRTCSEFNLGESGNIPRTVREVLNLSGLDADSELLNLGNICLRDAPHQGSLELRQLIAQLYSNVEPEQILVTTGTSEALLLYFCLKNFRKVALLWPAFQLLYEIPVSLGADLVKLPIAFDDLGRPQKNWKEWQDTIQKEQPDCILINHPHNPSGLVFDDFELERWSEISKKCGADLMSDEHYRLLSPSFSPAQKTLQGYGTVFGSFIKVTGTPGLRIGWCVASEDVVNAMRALKDYTTHTVSPLVERIAIVALTNVHSELFSRARFVFQTNQTVLKKWLEESQTWAGSAPEGGLVCCVFPKQHQSQEALRQIELRLIQKGCFLLNLEHMEFESTPLPLTFKHGFRLGLGLETSLFSKALEILAQVTTSHP